MKYLRKLKHEESIGMNKFRKIKAYSLRVGDIFGKEGIIEIEDRLEILQEYVGGSIDIISLGVNNLVIVLNTDGKIKKLKTNRVWVNDDEVKDIIVGDCLVCRSNAEGELVSVEEDDIAVINSMLKVMIGFDGENAKCMESFTTKEYKF